MTPGTVDVFPITSTAFGLSPDWFNVYASKLIHPAYLLMTLLLIISIGIMVLKRFENSDLEKKLWNIPVIIVILSIWPALIFGIKALVDIFNTFLVQDVFQIPWHGFGFSLSAMNASTSNNSALQNIFSTPLVVIGGIGKLLITFLPSLSYWIIYAFYIVFFFFFAVLGPFVLAKGILFDEIDAFLELVKEVSLLFLWQTTFIILVAFIMPDMVSGKPLSAAMSFGSDIFLSLVLTIMILFVPSITRKFGNHLGSSFFPPVFKGAALMLGLSAVTKGLAMAGAPIETAKWESRSHTMITGLEFRKRYQHQNEVLQLKEKNYELEHKADQHPDDDDNSQNQDNFIDKPDEESVSNFSENNRNPFLYLSKRAKRELNDNKD